VTERSWTIGNEAIDATVRNSVAFVTLKRPDAANARNQQMRNELKAAWTAIAADTEINAVVLSGEGDRFFCAGMDLNEAAGAETAVERRDRLRGSRDIEQLAALPQPTIAAINGYALGGGLEMALACDLRLVADTAQLGLTEVVHGLVPGGGGTQRLPRLVGHARAADLIFTGRKLDAAEAASWGLVNRVVLAAELATEAEGLATAIAANSGRALRYAKELLRQSSDIPIGVGAQLELDALLTLMAN
jgi:enoyl-CoA hydratase/carnithine racemase